MSHLTEEQFVEWASGERNDEAAQHLRECAQCIDEVRRLSLALEGFKAEINDGASARYVPFTGAQIRALAAAQAKPKRSLWRMLPVPALAAIAVLAVVLSQPDSVKAPTPNTDAADDALLMAVNTDVYRTAPAALRPVAALSKERNQLLSGSEKKK